MQHSIWILGMMRWWPHSNLHVWSQGKSTLSYLNPPTPHANAWPTRCLEYHSKVAVVYALRFRVHPWWRGSWNLSLWGLQISLSMTPKMKPSPVFFGCCCRWLFNGRKSGTLQARWNESAECIEFACIFEPTGSCGSFSNNFVGGAFGCRWIRTFYAVLLFASHWVEIPFSMSRLSPEL